MLQYDHSTCAQLSWLPIVPSLQQARLPVVALMGVSLLGERLLVDRLHMWLEVDGQDQVDGRDGLSKYGSEPWSSGGRCER